MKLDGTDDQRLDQGHKGKISINCRYVVLNFVFYHLTEEVLIIRNIYQPSNWKSFINQFLNSIPSFRKKIFFKILPSIRKVGSKDIEIIAIDCILHFFSSPTPPDTDPTINMTNLHGDEPENREIPKKKFLEGQKKNLKKLLIFFWKKNFWLKKYFFEIICLSSS